MWLIRSRGRSFEWKGELVAVWEVDYDPITDDYTPAEISASDLLLRWAPKVRKLYPDGLVPISWYVDSPGNAKFERMPFQHSAHEAGLPHDFLTYYGWPEDAKTGAPLNWLTLPVVDKLWNKQRSDKGGFIQEATGWKPAILQPHVYLPTLLETWSPWRPPVARPERRG